MLAHYEPNSVAGAGRGIASRNTAHHTTAKHRITSWTVPGNLFAVCTHRVSATFIWELGNFHMGSRRLSYGILATFTWDLGDFRMESGDFTRDLGDFRMGPRRLSHWISATFTARARRVQGRGCRPAQQPQRTRHPGDQSQRTWQGSE